MISYSARAAKALGFLKQRYNDVEIFVEDASGHAMWLRLMRKLLPGNLRLESVNVLGGRNDVIEACRLDQIKDGRKKLYIVDGDFDYVTNKSPSSAETPLQIEGLTPSKILFYTRYAFFRYAETTILP